LEPSLDYPSILSVKGVLLSRPPRAGPWPAGLRLTHTGRRHLLRVPGKAAATADMRGCLSVRPEAHGRECGLVADEPKAPACEIPCF
jgi:hypothetical protein